MNKLLAFLLYHLTATAYTLDTEPNVSDSALLPQQTENPILSFHKLDRSIIRDENLCHGISGEYWVMSRNIAVDNVHHFCGQNVTTMRYNEDTVNELELEVKNWNEGMDERSPRDAPDCIDRFTNAVIDGCDGNDMLNNPYNYKFGATLRTTDGWQYRMTPWSRQINDVRCDTSYKANGNDRIEIRGKNFPSALMGSNGEGLRDELAGCGALTAFEFELTPEDCCFQWYARGDLPTFKKKCVGRAIQSAGGSSTGGCKRDASGIEDWPGYGDSYLHVFKHASLEAGH